jgi:hypothetical protein
VKQVLGERGVMADLKIVRVHWIDAQDHKDKWVDVADAEAFAEQDCQIVSVGYLVRNTEKYITLAGDFDAVDQDYGRVTKIPVGMVQSLTELT